MELLQYANLIAVLLFQVVILHALLKSVYRQLPVFFFYCVFTLLSTVAVAAAFVDVGYLTKEAAKIYWIADGGERLLAFAALAELIWKSLGDRARPRTLAYMVMAMVICIALAVGLSYDHRLNLWMTTACRNITFSSVVLNLALWTLLMGGKNRLLLALCAGFGIELAGAAMGHSLRQLSRHSVLAGNLVIMSTYLVTLYIWSRALRSESVQPVPQTGRVAGECAT